MNDDDLDYVDLRPDDPVVFRAPPPEIMAELRRLLPPVPLADERVA
jgi:hypothetical protein